MLEETRAVLDLPLRRRTPNSSDAPCVGTFADPSPEQPRSRPSLRSAVLSLEPNALACQLLLGYRKLESTVRNLGIEVDDALELSEHLAI